MLWLSVAGAILGLVIVGVRVVTLPEDRVGTLVLGVVGAIAGTLSGQRLHVLLDHVASPAPVIRAVQRLLDPLFVRLAAGVTLGEFIARSLRRPQLAVRPAWMSMLRRNRLQGYRRR